MATIPSPGTKARQRSCSGSIRLDERPPNSIPRSPIPIAPRPIYDSLQSDETRLLDLSPSQDRSSPIRAALRHGLLRSREYEALTDMCGIEESPTTIHVNGQPLTISGSLLEVLRDLRSERKHRTLWINSICINQNDREEKATQLERRAEALSHAAGFISRTWDATESKYVLNYTKPNPWSISGLTSSPAPNSALPEIGSIESMHSLGIADCQFYLESPSALVSSPGSPQTDSASSSPESNAGFHIQTSSLGTFPFPFGSSDSWADNVDGPGHHRLSIGDEVIMKTAITSRCKRSLGTAFSDEPTITAINHKPTKIQRTTEGVNERGSGVVFACPFQKYNPEKYHRCLKYTLNRIKDVKQHIYRQHIQPPLYCARCYEVFGSTGDRDKHTRRVECKNRDPPQFEGISELQRTELKKSSPKKKSLQEQWFEVWDVIFPDRQRPQSAFIGNYVEEMVPLLRDLWDKRRAEIISDAIDSRSRRDGIDSQLLADVMTSVFDRFEAETTRSCQRTSTEGTCSPAFPPLPYVSQDSDFSFEIGSPFAHHGLQQMVVPDFDASCALDLENYYFSQSV